MGASIGIVSPKSVGHIRWLNWQRNSKMGMPGQFALWTLWCGLLITFQGAHGQPNFKINSRKIITLTQGVRTALGASNTGPGSHPTNLGRLAVRSAQHELEKAVNTMASAIFASLDQNNDGNIGPYETGIWAVYWKAYDNIFDTANLNTDGNGEISYSEYVAAAEKMNELGNAFDVALGSEEEESEIMDEQEWRYSYSSFEDPSKVTTDDWDRHMLMMRSSVEAVGDTITVQRLKIMAKNIMDLLMQNTLGFTIVYNPRVAIPSNVLHYPSIFPQLIYQSTVAAGPPGVVPYAVVGIPSNVPYVPTYPVPLV